MQPEDRVRLEHMLDAAQAALGFVAERTREDFDRDRLLFSGVVRMLQVIGEAAWKVSDTVREQMPAVPWHKIIGARHRLVHAYFDIDAETVWLAATRDLEPLIHELRLILNSP